MDEYVWLSITDVAREYHKSRPTIHGWVRNGFILTLGWKVRQDPTGCWHIGVPREEYSHWMTNPLAVATTRL